MENRVVVRYISLQRRYRVILLIVILLTIGGAIWSLLMGLPAILSHVEVPVEKVISIRGVRIMAAILVGMLLSLSGVVMQTLLRNPLASPYTLGISNAAAFGAALAILFLGGINVPGVTFIAAFATSLVGLAVILLIASIRSGGVERVILAGVIINSLFASGIALLQYIADSAQLASILFWTFGDLGRGEWNAILILMAVAVISGIFLYSQRWDYKALEVNDEYARSVGVVPARVRMIGLIVASLITAIAVSIFGVIAFVGLAVPHIVRRVVGTNLNYLLPVSIFAGALFMVLCDMASKHLFAPTMLPIGIVTSILGVPIFLVVLLTFKRG